MLTSSSDMEKRFFKNLLEGDQAPPPKEVITGFQSNFDKAINIEWYKKDGDFEAIFYNNQLEYIARFKPNGILIEYKINIPPTQLPPYIIETIHSIGEIMSSVLIQKLNQLHYEVIVRNSILQRLVVILNEEGEILDRKFL